MRRVVVTGLGAVTPLAVGSWILLQLQLVYIFIYSGWKRTWARLLASDCGITKLSPKVYHHDVTRQQCRIAGLVPQDEWLESQATHFSPDVSRLLRCKSFVYSF